MAIFGHFLRLSCWRIGQKFTKKPPPRRINPGPPPNFSKNRHAGQISRKNQIFLFSPMELDNVINNVEKERYQKKLQYPRKKRDFINPSEFSQKSPFQKGGKNR